MSYIIISTTATRGFLLFPLLLALSAFRRCDSDSSRATYYGSPDTLGTETGSCGYGEYGRTVLGGYVAGVSGRLYESGSGCGACYHLTCRRPYQCSKDGATVVVTDSGGSDYADFVLSGRAFAKLAGPGRARGLFGLGAVQVEYQRIPCSYPGNNIHVQVHENSRMDEYLAVIIQYQGGAYQLSAVEILQEGLESTPMRNAFGCVWDSANPPEGALSLRLELLAEDGGHRSLELTEVIPEAWEAGRAYDANIQLS